MTSSVGAVVGVATCSNIRVRLCNAKLWRQFHACTNEMIITKAGRLLAIIRPVDIKGRGLVGKLPRAP